MKEPIRILQVIVIAGGGVEAVILNYYEHIDRSKVQFPVCANVLQKTIRQLRVHKQCFFLERISIDAFFCILNRRYVHD